MVDEFVGAFGAPHRKEGRDLQWSLRRLRYVAAVNVVLSVDREPYEVWVFNPHDPSNGVYSRTIKNESDIAPIIQMIKQNVAGAP
jgi:hypothetical protein